MTVCVRCPAAGEDGSLSCNVQKYSSQVHSKKSEKITGERKRSGYRPPCHRVVPVSGTLRHKGLRLIAVTPLPCAKPLWGSSGVRGSRVAGPQLGPARRISGRQPPALA